MQDWDTLTARAIQSRRLDRSAPRFAAVDARRAKVRSLAARGWTEGEIARRLGITVAVAKADIAALVRSGALPGAEGRRAARRAG